MNQNQIAGICEFQHMVVITPGIVGRFSPNAATLMTLSEITDEPQKHGADAAQNVRIILRRIGRERMRRQVIENDVVAPSPTKMRNADDFRIWKTRTMQDDKACKFTGGLFHDVACNLFLAVDIRQLNA